MSHLSKVSIKLTNAKAIEVAAKAMEWAMQKQDFTNSYSRETVKNATVLRDKSGKVKYVIGVDGTPVVDEWSMARDYYRFNQEYTQHILKQKAIMSGAAFRNCGVDAKGNLVLEIEVR